MLPSAGADVFTAFSQPIKEKSRLAVPEDYVMHACDEKLGQWRQKYSFICFYLREIQKILIYKCQNNNHVCQKIVISTKTNVRSNNLFVEITIMSK